MFTFDWRKGKKMYTQQRYVDLLINLKINFMFLKENPTLQRIITKSVNISARAESKIIKICFRANQNKQKINYVHRLMPKQISQRMTMCRLL